MERAAFVVQLGPKLCEIESEHWSSTLTFYSGGATGYSGAQTLNTCGTWTMTVHICKHQVFTGIYCSSCL